MIWHAAEPLVAADPGFALDWLSANGANHLPLSGKLAAKLMRRLCDLGGASLHGSRRRLPRTGPAGKPRPRRNRNRRIRSKGQEGKALLPSQPIGPFIAKLIGSGNAGITERGQKLGSLGDATALKSILTQALDATAPVDQRLHAIQTVHRSRNEATRSAMLQLLGAEVPEPLQIEALAALGEIGGDDVPKQILQRWKGMSPAARRAAAATLASRRSWALPLLAQVREGTLSASDFGAPVIRRLCKTRTNPSGKRPRPPSDVSASRAPTRPRK